jgi:hypothetical protein
MRLEELGQLKNPMTSWRTEPATCRLASKVINFANYRTNNKDGGSY